jgi:hypothetical protein
VMTIHGCVRDLQSASVALRQGKGPFHWATHQILGVTSKKVRLENSFGACDAHASRYWEKICTGGVRISSVNLGLTLSSQFLIENNRPIRVVLGFQMALEGSRY